MSDFLLRDVDSHVIEQLKRRACENGRSLQAEIHDTLKRSVRLSKTESIALIKRLHEAGPHLTSDSTADIRADRDSR